MKNRFFRKSTMAVLMAGILMLSACGGGQPSSQGAAGGTDADAGGVSNESSEPITITFFDKNLGHAFSDPVADRIKEVTGVNVEIQQPTGDPEEKLNLMLASGDLPDVVLMDRRSDIVNKYISAGALIPLNDLIDEYAPDVAEMYGDVLNKSRYVDGKNYFLNNWYGIDSEPDRGINIRMDLLKEMGYGERAEAGDYFTQEEFIDMLRTYKEMNPDAIPFTLSGEYMESVYSTFRGMYGMKFYYEQDDGELQLSVRDPRYLEMMKFINLLYREGLVDKEWAINNSDLLQQKLISGNVMASTGIENANSIFRDDEGMDTDKQFYMFRVVADGADPNATTFSPRSSLGWDAIGITVSNEHPEETMKFINYLASEEGQFLLMWGVEGVHWNWVDGERVPEPEIIPGFRDDWSAYSKESGVRKWTWFIKNGEDENGIPYDLVGRYDVDQVAEANRVSMVGSVWDTAIYDNIGPLGGTPEALTEQVLKDIMDQGFTKMAYADSEEELEAEYNNMMAELEANNAASIEEIYTNNYRERLELQS